MKGNVWKCFIALHLHISLDLRIIWTEKSKHFYTDFDIDQQSSAYERQRVFASLHLKFHQGLSPRHRNIGGAWGEGGGGVASKGLWTM